MMGVLMIRIPSAAKTASKEEVNLVSRSRMRNLTGVVGSVSSQQRLRACLGDPAGDRVGRHPGDADEAGAVLDEEQHVEPPEQDGVDREEVAGDQALGLGMKELPPRGTRASRRGIDSPTLQDRPDAGRREHDRLISLRGSVVSLSNPRS
jgi:hypothetical protein